MLELNRAYTERTYTLGFCFSDDIYQIASVTFNGKELVRYDYDGYGDWTAIYGRDGKKLRGFAYRNHINKEVSGSLEEKTGFIWDGRYTYIYTNLDSYEPLAQVRDWTTEDGENRQQTHYFHCDQIGIPREMTDD